MRKFFTLVAVLALAVSAPAFASDISGSWQLEMMNQMGQTEAWVLTIKDNGGNLTIEAVHPMFGNVAGTGTLSGDKVTMHMVVSGGIGKVVTDFEGTLKGDKMEGTRTVGYDHSEDEASGDSGGGAPEGGAPGGAPAGDMPAGGGAPGGDMPAGGAPGGAPGGGAPGGDAQAGGGPGGGAPAGEISDAWTAVRK